MVELTSLSRCVCSGLCFLCSLPSTVIVCPSHDYFDPTLINLTLCLKTCLFTSVFDNCFFSVLQYTTLNFVWRKTQWVKVIHIFKDHLALPVVSMLGFKTPPSCFWHRPRQYGCQCRGLLCLSGFIDPTCEHFYIAPHYVSTILRNASVLTLVPLCCGLVCFMFASLRRLVSALWQQQRGCWDSWLTDCKLLYYSPLGVIKTPIIVTAPQFTHIWCTVTRIRGVLDRFGFVFKHNVWTGDRLVFCLSVWFFLI